MPSTSKHAEIARAYRARHPERVRANRRRQYDARKRRAMELVGGAYCIGCGCDDLDFLEFNHIGGGGSAEWRQAKSWIVDRLLSGERKPDGLNVLCRVCNAIEYLERKKPSAEGQHIVTWSKK